MRIIQHSDAKYSIYYCIRMELIGKIPTNFFERYILKMKQSEEVVHLN